MKLFLFAVVVCLGGLAVLGKSVVEQLRGLETANSDNLQWTLTQASVEYLNLRIAVNDANERVSRAAEPDLAKLRQRFDVLYSRMDTLASGPVYASLLEDPDFGANYHLVAALMEEMIPLVDLPDAQLSPRLNELTTLVQRAEMPVRELSLKGLARFSELSDQRRETVTDLLVRLAGVTLALVLLISLMAFTLSRLYRQSELRAAVLRDTSLRLETIIKSALDGVIVFDRQGTVLDWNGAASRIFEIPQEKALGGALFEMILPEAGRAEQLGRVRDYLYDRSADRSGPERITLNARRPDGKVFALELAIETTKDATGAINVAFARDIDAQLHAEAELKEARDRAVAGQEAKAHFLAVMSHEMRTPLNGLLGAMALLRETAIQPDQVKLIEMMDLSGRLVLRHVNDVLDVTEFEAGKLKPEIREFDIGQMVGEVVTSTSPLASARRNRLDWKWCSPPVGRVLGDGPRIMQVLLNLVSNAIKFTEDGEITVELRAAPSGDESGKLAVEIRVIDTGIGIAPEDQTRIFEDFATVDPSYGRASGGTGLGLGIAQRLAKMMGGTIGLASELGKGSTFWLQLDLARAQPAAAQASEGEAAAPVGKTSRKLSILVVEDNEINRTILRRMVEAAGHEVAEATNGREGVDLAAVRQFDLILMDISMPVMDGREATRAIRTGSGASREARIVAVTAHAMPEEISSFLAYGIDECLEKPIDKDRLLHLLATTAESSARSTQEKAAPPASAISGTSASQLRQTLGDEQFADLVGRFIQETDEVLLKDIPAGRSDGEIAAELHRCAGAAGFLGATSLQAAIRQFEAEYKAGQSDALARNLPELRQLWSRTREELSHLAKNRIVA